MDEVKSRGPLEWLILLIGVGMSAYHIQIAYTGGYEPLFQRTVSYLFGMSMLFLVYRSPKGGGWRPLAVAATFLLVIVTFTYPSFWGYDYFDNRLYYVDPLRPIDFILGSAAILLTLEATRRTINNALPLIALFFLVYTYFGPYFPWEFGHAGASFAQIVDHQFMTYDGMWTTPISVFSIYIFLFILFGAFLDRMGAANFYVQLAIAAAGRLRGGPAKAAVFASALTGTIMGSANANVVTTGSFTIPMMKRTGFRPEIAAGIETAASTGGQIMPPIMGASAFLIVEFTGISYWEIVKVSIMPAILYFFSVYAMVHLEARKQGLVGLPRDQIPPLAPILKAGWYHLLPPIIILAILMTGRAVPYAGLAGILAVVILGGVDGVRGLLAKARREGAISGREALSSIGRGLWNIVEAMEQGARQSLPICAAVGAVGIIMGALFQTGLGSKFASMVTALAGDSMFLGIIMVGLASFVLGMGLPTSAAYIVLSVMAVPALLELGEPYNLSLLAAHLIVFWYSLDSCFTPPVCVPAYTAAGIAGANPAKAAWASFRTAKGIYVLPFMFVFTPILLIRQPLLSGETFIAALFGFQALAAVMVGHMYFPLSLITRGMLALATLLLFWPGVQFHFLGLLILGAMFLHQRRRLADEGESAPEPAAAI